MVITAEDYACLAEYRVVLAWLADPETCPCQLRAQVCNTHLEIHGTIPSQKVRARALQLAGLNSGKATIDSLSVMPALSAPKQRPGAESPAHLRAMCQQALDEGAGKVVFDLHVDVDANGCVTVQGTIPSYEEKLVVSQRLRRVPGCACVRNNLTIWNIMDVGKPYVLVTANGSHLVPLESMPTMQTVAAADVPVKAAGVLSMKGPASAPGVSSSTSGLSRPFAGLFQKIAAPAKTPAASAPAAVASAPPTAPAKPPAMPAPAAVASAPMPNPIASTAPRVTPPTSASAVKPASVLAERDRLTVAPTPAKKVAPGLNQPMAPVAKPRDRAAAASGDIYISPHVALRTETPRRGTVPVPPEIDRIHCRTAGTQGGIVTLPVMASRMPLPPTDQAVRPMMQTDVATKMTAPSVTAPSVASVAPAAPTMPAAPVTRTQAPSVYAASVAPVAPTMSAAGSARMQVSSVYAASVAPGAPTLPAARTQTQSVYVPSVAPAAPTMPAATSTQAPSVYAASIAAAAPPAVTQVASVPDPAANAPAGRPEPSAVAVAAQIAPIPPAVPVGAAPPVEQAEGMPSPEMPAVPRAEMTPSPAVAVTPADQAAQAEAAPVASANMPTQPPTSGAAEAARSTIVQSSFQTPPPMPDAGLRARRPNPTARQPESVPPESSPPAALPRSVVEAVVVPHPIGQPPTALPESAPPAPLAEAAAPVQHQYALVEQPQVVTEQASQPSAPLPVPAAYASASPATTLTHLKGKPATTGPVSTGVVVMPQSQDETTSAAAAVQVQAWLRHVVVNTCGSDADDVQLQLHSCSEIALKVRTSKPTLARSLAERILRLPELIPYRVALEIQVKKK